MKMNDTCPVDFLRSPLRRGRSFCSLRCSKKFWAVATEHGKDFATILFEWREMREQMKREGYWEELSAVGASVYPRVEVPTPVVDSKEKTL